MTTDGLAVDARDTRPWERHCSTAKINNYPSKRSMF